VSEFAKDEAVRYFGADPKRIDVVYSGPGLFSSEHVTAAAARDGEPFFVYVGNLGGNKNLPFLVRAFHRADLPARLVLAGRARGSLTEIDRAIRAGVARDRIEIRRNVSDVELEELYRSALALLLPSIYEGFGFTSLEAMARGCPVVESDIPALREISGAGAMLVPLGDEEAWAAAMRRIAGDEAARDDLRERGAATVSHYSWDKTARGVLDVLAAAAARL
jgi:glycosyltransferase involved in cell wall biosynthesis